MAFKINQVHGSKLGAFLDGVHMQATILDHARPHSLESGFVTFSAKEWFDLGPNAAWRGEKTCDCETPFKPEGSPFFVLPGLDSPEKIMIDSAHTWHIGTPSFKNMLQQVCQDFCWKLI